MARPKLGESETERLHIKITADEIKAIDDWRYENRVPSKSEAVRRLIQIGLLTDAPVTIAGEGATELYERVRRFRNDLVSEGKRLLELDADDHVLTTLEKAIEEADSIFEEIEYLQTLLQATANQVAEVGDADTAIRPAMSAADDWKQEAVRHIKRIARRQASRAKRSAT